MKQRPLAHSRGPILALAALLSMVGCTRGPDRPNVLFILADDLRWDALGSYGNAQIATPNLDRLASEGVALDAFYVASPVCVASRLSLHSGRYVIEPGIAPKLGGSVRPETPTVARILAAMGYWTAFIGKTHATKDPLSLGFDEAPFFHVARRFAWPGHRRKQWVRRRRGQELEVEDVKGDPTTATIDAAIAFLEEQPPDPWLLWLSTTAPHYPYYAHPEYGYEAESLRPPPGYPPDQELQNAPLWRVYYQLVSHLDAELGRLLAALDRLGLRERTLVVLTSDNGIMHGSHGILTKGVWHEGSTRQPFIARWPGVIAPGTRSDGLASSVDWLPTVAELAGAAPPAGLEGRSLLPMLRGEPSGRDVVFSVGRRHPKDGGGAWTMVRSRDEKLVRFDDEPDYRYYDLRRDPFELDGEVEGRVGASAQALGERIRVFRAAYGRSEEVDPEIHHEVEWEEPEPPGAGS